GTCRSRTSASSAGSACMSRACSARTRASFARAGELGPCFDVLHAARRRLVAARARNMTLSKVNRVCLFQLPLAEASRWRGAARSRLIEHALALLAAEGARLRGALEGARRLAARDARAETPWRQGGRRCARRLTRRDGLEHVHAAARVADKHLERPWPAASLTRRRTDRQAAHTRGATA